MTLYNAGYKKQDIEESAAALQQIIQQKSVVQSKPSQPIQQPVQPNFEKPTSKIKLILILAITIMTIVLVFIAAPLYLIYSKMIYLS